MNSHGFGGAASPGADAFAAMLAPVKDAFLVSLHDHIVAFEAFPEVSEAPQADAAKQDLAHRAHKIAGVAATLNYRRLGQLAANLEAELSADSNSGEVRETIGQLTCEIKAALQAR